MTVDVRTRVDGPVELVDPARFGEELADAFERQRELLSRAVGVFAPPSLVIESEGNVWTLAADGDCV
ncbi:MAG: hypothetical protein QOF40_2898, partial [Actinomycetota bacterium]|nr:hypothetical protein [Actinomycetota bacterium]